MFVVVAQEAHAMVHEAKMKQTAAEKKLMEATNQVISHINNYNEL